jgi:hypothetical protein
MGEMRTLWIKSSAVFAVVCTCALVGESLWSGDQTNWLVIAVIGTMATIIFAWRSYSFLRAESGSRRQRTSPVPPIKHSEKGILVSHLSEYSSGEDEKILQYINDCHSVKPDPKSVAISFENLEEIATLDDFLGETLAQVRTDFISATEGARSSDALHYARIFKLLSTLKDDVSKLSTADAPAT